MKLEDLALVTPQAAKAVSAREEQGAGRRDADVIGIIERLFELKKKGVLTDDEFEKKKADLLSRL